MDFGITFTSLCFTRRQLHLRNSCFSAEMLPTDKEYMNRTHFYLNIEKASTVLDSDDYIKTCQKLEKLLYCPKIIENGNSDTKKIENPVNICCFLVLSNIFRCNCITE